MVGDELDVGGKDAASKTDIDVLGKLDSSPPKLKSERSPILEIVLKSTLSGVISVRSPVELFMTYEDLRD